MGKYENNYKHSGLTKKIISEVYHVHNVLGSGFLEKVYENALHKRLKDMGMFVQKQFPIKVHFEEELVGEYFADLIVDEKVIIELKVATTLHPIHEVQLVNYLKATMIEVGLLINFGDGVEIKRKVFSNNQDKNLMLKGADSSTEANVKGDKK